MSTSISHTSATHAGARVTERYLAAVFAAALGTVILFGAAFAPMEVVHNAAHDSRHSFSVPCH